MNRFLVISAWATVAVAGLAGCESLSRAAGDIRDVATHDEPHLNYPSLIEVPAKPTPSTTPAQRNAAVQQLRDEKARTEGAAQDLRDQAATMQTLPVPGQPDQPSSTQPPAPAQPQ